MAACEYHAGLAIATLLAPEGVREGSHLSDQGASVEMTLNSTRRF